MPTSVQATVTHLSLSSHHRPNAINNNSNLLAPRLAHPAEFRHSYSSVSDSALLTQPHIHVINIITSKISIDAFLADRTNGRAYGTICRLSVCRHNVMYCGYWLNGTS